LIEGPDPAGTFEPLNECGMRRGTSEVNDEHPYIQGRDWNPPTTPRLATMSKQQYWLCR